MSDCSPANRLRELGLDRRETGLFYPTLQESPRVVGVSTRGTRQARRLSVIAQACADERLCATNVRLKASRPGVPLRGEQAVKSQLETR